jgi:uncharacterized protein YaiL (DUF2058 family)
MPKTLQTEVLIGVLVALSAIGALVAHEVRVNSQTAAATSKIAAEREKAEQIDREDKAAIQKIRERNAQKAATAPNR